jgi:hypothetical protein
VATRSITLSVLAAAVALSGCATPKPPPSLSLSLPLSLPPSLPPSLKDSIVAAPGLSPPAEETLDCAGRHLDREAGRPPAGATTLEQKQADDRVCGEEYRYPGYLKAH